MAAYSRQSISELPYQTVQYRKPDLLDADHLANIDRWRGLAPHNFTFRVDRIDTEAIEKTLYYLQRYGIARLKPRNFGWTDGSLRDYAALFCQISDRQNDYEGEVKRLVPTPGVEPNTGSSAGDLGFHVDGTQTEFQPAILIFQYEQIANLGANSKFLDLARVLFDIETSARERLLMNLSAKDAATFKKKGMTYTGKIFDFPDGRSLAARLRFDEVISVKPECLEDFEFLRNQLRQGYAIEFKPDENDVIVFDNWRIMHARTAVASDNQRVHRRIWCNALAPQYLPNYQLGIRPITDRLRLSMP